MVTMTSGRGNKCSVMMALWYSRAVTWATVINSCMDVLVDTDHVMEQLAQCGKLLCTNSPIGY